MEPLDFIQKNVSEQLRKEGFSAYISENCARESVAMFKRKSHFAKGKAFTECLKLAKKQAKLMEKAL